MNLMLLLIFLMKSLNVFVFVSCFNDWLNICGFLVFIIIFENDVNWSKIKIIDV